MRSGHWGALAVCTWKADTSSWVASQLRSWEAARSCRNGIVSSCGWPRRASAAWRALWMAVSAAGTSLDASACASVAILQATAHCQLTAGSKTAICSSPGDACALQTWQGSAGPGVMLCKQVTWFPHRARMEQRAPLCSLSCPAQPCSFILCLLHIADPLCCLIQGVLGLSFQVLPYLPEMPRS